MPYFPTIDLTEQTKMLLARGALRLQPGQWVRSEQAVGRYLRTDLRRGVNYVSWVRPGDSFKSHSQRFRRACEKGFVGKYASRYDAVRAAREAARAMTPADPAREPARTHRDQAPTSSSGRAAVNGGRPRWR